MASSGRTSAPPDARVSPETYRIGGFRPCGDRVVRVDIVERLADMIRAASVLRVVNGSDSGPPAFQVTSQMTSLTGCSGDGFSSVLRALGFESLTLHRNEIVWPAAAMPATPISAMSDGESPESNGAEAKGAGADQQDSPEATGGAESGEPAGVVAEGVEAADLEAAPSAEAAPSSRRAPSDDVHPWALEAPAPEPAIATDPAQAPSSEPPAEIGSAPGDPIEAAQEPHDPLAPSPAETPASVQLMPLDASPPDIEASAPDSIGLADPAAAPSLDAPPEIRPAADLSTEAPSKQAQEAKAAVESESITVWRFARPPNPRHAKPRYRQARRIEPRGAPLQPSAGRSGGEAADAASHAESVIQRTGRPAAVGKPAREGRHKTWDSQKAPAKPDERRDGRPPAGSRSGGEKRPVVDPMSPFAKLMELRSILESESKKRT